MNNSKVFLFDLIVDSMLCLVSSGITADYEPEDGKRVKPKYYDILEDDESDEPSEIIMDMIRERARG